MKQSPMPRMLAELPGSFQRVALVSYSPISAVSSAPSIAPAPSAYSYSPQHFLDPMGQMRSDVHFPSKIFFERGSTTDLSNYVVQRDHAGRPVVWKINGMTRRITYLGNGKIKNFEDTGKLVPLAASAGAVAYLLGFETHDGGRTYIGRLMVGQEIDSLIMTDLYMRNDGTVVATDDSGLEMTWNPNNGDAGTEFTEHNHRRESWTDHLDGTITLNMSLDNGTTLEMNGSYSDEFCANRVTIRSNGTQLDFRPIGASRVYRTITDSTGQFEATEVDVPLSSIVRSLMSSDSLSIEWLRKISRVEASNVVEIEHIMCI
jgi:hypothetical protein